MKIELDHIYFSVSDMDKAVKFYEDFLGIKATHREGSRWADFEIEGQEGMYFGLIDKKALKDFRERALNNESPNTRGTAQNDDIYFQNTEVRNKYYNDAISITEMYMNKINKIAKTNYSLFNYYGDTQATDIIIAMGSVCPTIE